MGNKNEKVQDQGFMSKLSSMNKWFYAFLAAAVLFVGAIVAVLIMALGGDKTPETNLPTEGAETGVYYYDAERGEYELSFNSGNKFTITGPDLNKSGEYAVNGSEIALDFVKDEDGTATVTIADNVLTMLWNNTEMRFLKKVSFTVSFQTSGGSDVASVSVLNGKTVAKPADPTKEGNAFIGWYTDSAYTKEFNFDTTVIGADTTVYARWIALEVGKSEYTVQFNLGYDATALAPAPTYNSALHTLPTPERTGYTFAGWWVSAYEDGAKLTYAYTAGTELNADTTLYALWIDNASQKLAAPAVSVTGNAIKWDAVTGATAYELTITNAAGEEVLKKTTGTTNETFDFSAQAAGDYTVSVVAKANDVNKNSEPAIRYYRNKALDRVAGYSVIDGMLVTWNPVAGAQKYLVTVDCGDDEHTHLMLDNGRNTFFNIANCPMQKGGIKITVVAVANGYTESVATTYTYEKNLDAISGITYNEATYSFEWARVENAMKYYVLVKCAGHTHALVDNGASTSYCVKHCTGALEIEVYPATAGYNSPEATKTAYDKKTLPAPTNVALTGKQLTWDAVTGATSYQIKIGDKTVTATTNSYNIDDAGITFVGGVDYAITVVAVGTANSAPSDVLNAKFAALTDVTYYNKTVSWAPVIGVTNYEVSVNGSEVIPVTGATSVKITLTKAGVNTVGVRYVGAPEWTTIEVYAYELVYDSRSISGVAKEYLAVGDAMTMPTDFTLDGYTFDGWYNAPGGAAGNGVPYPHAVFSETANTVLYANWAPKTYNVVFYGCEGVSNINTGDTFPVTYTKHFKLPVPDGGDAAGFFGWYTLSGEAITDAEGNSLVPYGVTRDTAICPSFDTGVVSYTLRPDGTYAASKGPAIDTAESVKVYATYKGVPVTAIPENGFYDCDNMKHISIPDTIQLIGTGAFNSCNYLESFDVYAVETATPHEVVYFSDDGALLYYDEASDATYLEVFPRGKTGHYKMSDEVDIIRNLAFDTVSISSIEISKNVSLIVQKAFYNCKSLESVSFAFEGTTPLTLEAGAFTACTFIKVLVLPARMNALASMRELDILTKLEKIDIEEGNQHYSAVDGMLCDSLGQTVLYCPVGYAGNNGVFSFATSVRTIAPNVFDGNPNIKEVIIPASMDEIGAKAFFRCSGIEKVTIEGNRSKPLSIGSQAFAECAKLAEVNFGSANSTATALDAGAITVGDSAFASSADNPGKLKTVNVYAGVNIASIGNSAFENNIDLTKLNVADNAAITAIGSKAFANTGFQTFTLHASTQTVGDQAFANCEYLIRFTFSANEKLNFGSQAFKDSKRLNEVVLPVAVKTFDPSALDGCGSIEKITVEAGNANFVSDTYGILYTAGYTEVIFYPSTLDGDLTKLPWDKLTTIGANVFKNNTKITSVTIGANVTEIASAAFQGCTNLTEVKFAGTSYANLVIGANAFNGCTKLAEIDLSKGVKTVGTAAFKGCSVMTKAVLPDTLTVIPESMFENCKVLATVNLPTALTTIGKNSFATTAIASVTIPNTVTSIADGAFRGCSKLTSLTFAPGGEKALTIGTATTTYGVFASSGLTGVVELPERLTVLGGYTFASCTKLTEVKFATNSKVTAINQYTFQSSGITKIDLTGIKTIGNYAFASCAQLTSVTIPTGVTSIGNNAFASSAVASVSLPNTLATIGNYAFQSSKLASVKIPASVTSIGTYAFKTTTLTAIEFELGGTAELTIGQYAFQNTRFTTIKLPARLTDIGGRANYASSNGQTKYKSYMAYRVFDGNTVLTEILVEEGAGNTIPTYGSYDGILYRNIDEVSGQSALYATLLYSPLAKTGTAHIAKQVTFVETLAFKNSKLTTIIFEEFDKVTEADKYGVPTLIVGETSTSGNYRCDPVFTGSAIHKIQFPSHLKRLNNYALGANDASVTLTYTGVEIVFNMDSLIEIGPYAFSKSPSIKALNLPKVAKIERNAFQGSTKLETVTMAEGSTVKEFLEQAFRGCTGLKSIVIPDSLTELQKLAFDGCTKLDTITWQNGCPNLTTIGDSVFANTAFTTFKIPDAVAFVGDNVWSGCQKLTKIEVSLAMFSGTSSQNTGLFTSCMYLKEIVVPEGHTFLKAEDGVLYSIDGATLYCYPQAKTPTNGKFEVPEGVVTIDYSALYRFSGTELVLPDSLEEIKAGGIQGALNITTIVIPAKVKVLGASAFSGCNSLTQITFATGSQLELIGDSAFSGCKLVTEMILPDNITKIGANAFTNCYKLETIVLPKALKKLESQTFMDCSALKNVTIQEGTTEIGENCFLRSGIETITLPDSLVTIADLAFDQCANLTTVVLSENGKLESIGNQAFQQNAKLTSVGFGSKLQSIGNQAFAGCTALKNVVPPDSATTIGKEAFKGCTALESVTMPAALEAIPASLFEDCTKLGAISIGAAVTDIGAAAFKNCAALTTVIFDPACAITTVKSEVFAGTTSLTAIAIPASVTKIEAKAFYQSGLSELSLPGALTTLGEEAFRECVNLEEVSIPNALTVIPAYAFADCTSLTTLNLYAGLERINDFAFSGCSSLAAVTIPATVERLGQNPFKNCPAISSFDLEEDVSFTLHEGVLYDKTMYTLLYYPASKTDETFTLPEKTKEIAGGAFSSSKLKKVVLHDEITVIPESAFENCALLEEVVMGDVTEIGNAAFKNCTSLAAFTVPASVKTIGDYAFAGCTALTNEGFKIAAESKLEKYGSHLFEGCTAITSTFNYFRTFTAYMYAGTGIASVTIPAGVDLNVKGVFANCKALTTITWSENFSSWGIGDGFFYGCTALESVALPEGLSCLGDGTNNADNVGVFGGCTALQSVTLPEGLYQIGVAAFEGCTALTDITYQAGGKEGYMLGARAFKGCTSFNNIGFAQSCMMIGEEAFMNCVNLAGELDFSAGKGVDLGNNAFYGCAKITGIHIGYGQFYAYSLAGLGTDGLGTGVTLYVHMDQKEFEGMFGKENPMDHCPNAELQFMGGGKGEGKEEKR